jgi:hypothetical protein
MTGLNGTTVLHAAYEVGTRDVPAGIHPNASNEAKQSRRLDLYRAQQFTVAYYQDIEAANRAGMSLQYYRLASMVGLAMFE